MTTVEFIKEQLSKNKDIRWRGTDIDSILEQADKINKSQTKKLYTKEQMEECWNAGQCYRAGYTNVRFEEFINNLKLK